MKAFSVDFIPWSILCQNLKEKCLCSDVNAVCGKSFAQRGYGENAVHKHLFIFIELKIFLFIRR